MPRLDAERVAIWRQMRSAAEVISRRIELELADEFDITLAQFDLLTVLAKAESTQRVRDLVESLRAVQSTLSRRIDALERQGYVERRVPGHDTDARAVEVVLTRSGRLLWRDANVAFRRALQREFSAHLDTSDLEALSRIFAKVPIDPPEPDVDDDAAFWAQLTGR